MLNDLAKAMKALDGKKYLWPEKFKRSLTPTQPVLATSMPGGSCYPPVHELVWLCTTWLLRLDTQISANSCAAAGSLAVLPLEESVENPLGTSSSYGTLMPQLLVLLRRIWRRSYHKCSPNSPTTQALRMGFSLSPLPRTIKTTLTVPPGGFCAAEHPDVMQENVGGNGPCRP